MRSPSTRLAAIVTSTLLVLLALLFPDLREFAVSSLLASLLIGGNLSHFEQSQKRLTETMQLVNEARRKTARLL